MRKILSLLLVAVMATSALAGCGPTGSGTTTTPSTVTPSTNTPNASAPAPGTPATPSAGLKEATVNITQEPPELNTLLLTDTISGNVTRHTMEALIRLDQSDNPISGVAEKWDIDETNTKYTFHLRQGMKWTNGDTVTAKDFEFAWKKLFTAEVAAQYASTWATTIVGAKEYLEGNGLGDTLGFEALDASGAVKGLGFRAVDDNTFEVLLTNPYPYFLSLITYPNFYPVNEKFYNEAGGDAAYGKEVTSLCTMGPYKIDAWTHESDLVLVKNADYYDAANIKLDKIKMVMIKDANSALNSFRAGEVDMINPNGDQTAQLRGEGLTVDSYEDGSVWYFEFNTTRPGLKNAKIRKALTMGVDAESFVKSVVKNDSRAAIAYTPSAVMGAGGKPYSDAVGTLFERKADYAEAKTLLAEGLAEEGLTAPLSIGIVCDDTDSAAKYNAYFQEQWKTNLGVEVKVESMPFKSRLERMKNNDFDVVMAGWSPDYNDPMSYLDLWLTGGGNNHTSWSNAEYDKNVSAAIIESDAAKRQEILIAAEKILIEEMPIGPIYNRVTNFICSTRLTGVLRSTFQDLNMRWADVA